MESPPLCRAIYHTTEINEEVPEELFIAIAQILAYIYQLEQFRAGRSSRPKSLPDDLNIPKGFHYKD